MISELSAYFGEIQLLSHKLANWGNHDMQMKGGKNTKEIRKTTEIQMITLHIHDCT